MPSLDSNVLDLITRLQAGSSTLSATRTDDDVLVIYRAPFDSSTGERLPSTVAGTVTQAEVREHLNEREAERAVLESFLGAFGLPPPAPSRVIGKTAVPRAFLAVLGQERGVGVWAWLWGQQFGGHPLVAYWLSFLILASEGVDVHSQDLLMALDALRTIEGPAGVPVLSDDEPRRIHDSIRGA